MNSAVTGIDFVLNPGGRVAGDVTSSVTGLPIPNVRIYFVAGSGRHGFFFTSALTNASGNYIMEGGTATGTVYVLTQNTLGYQDEVYNNIHCPDCNPSDDGGTPVGVTLGLTTSNINFVLDPGGRIGGTVTNAAGGAPLANVEVSIHSSSQDPVATVMTDGAGTYLTSGLPAGTYYVRTISSLGFVDELYNNLPCPGFNCIVTTGTPVVVTVGATTAGINFALVAGGQIGGTVTNAAGGAPIQDVQVRIRNAAGTFVGSATTNAAGTYLTSGLPAGTYYVRTSSSLGFLDELYNNLPCTLSNCTVTTGTPVVVTVGATTAGINFALVAGGQIGGTVTNAAGGAPIQNVQAQIYNAAGTLVGSVTTNAAGTYLTSGLPAGTYYVRTRNTLGFIDELYNNLPCTLAQLHGHDGDAGRGDGRRDDGGDRFRPGGRRADRRHGDQRRRRRADPERERADLQRRGHPPGERHHRRRPART